MYIAYLRADLPKADIALFSLIMKKQFCSIMHHEIKLSFSEQNYTFYQKKSLSLSWTS